MAMMTTYYYALTDDNDILCVDRLEAEAVSEQQVAALATSYPEAIYFAVEREARPCDIEFGGDHEHDDAECARMLDTMNGIGVDDGSWEREALNREAEEHSLGRPLFPNEC